MTALWSLTPDSPGPVLGADPARHEDLDSYLASGGYPGRSGPDALLDRIAEADLRGRGGAGFPAAVKLRAVREAGRTPVVVANGEEGEPGSVKDRWLLRARPHLVLDGLAQAAAVTGADRGYVYLSDRTAAERVRAALAERDPGLPVEVVLTGHTYVAGEESAVVRRIDGGPALPTAKPPRPFERGVGGAPTLIANVETLARIALLAARPGVPDSLLLTLSGGGAEPVLAEVPPGLRLRELARAQGVPDAAGVLMGGLFGGLLGPDRLDLPLDRTRLAEAGTGLGCGAIRFLGPAECPVGSAADVLDYLAAESTRQCGVCVSGTRALRDTLVALTLGRAAAADTANLLRWSGGLPGRGACGLLDAAARVAGSLLRSFPAQVEAHLGGPCAACAGSPPDAGRRLRVTVPHTTATTDPTALSSPPSPSSRATL